MLEIESLKRKQTLDKEEREFTVTNSHH